MNKTKLEILRLFLKTESINKSKTSIQADKLSEEYSNKLRNIMTMLFSENQSIELLRMKHGKRILKLYQELGQKTYLLSLNYMERSSGIYPLISSVDIESIKTKAVSDSERFWSILSKKEDQIKTESFNLASLLNFITSSVTGLVYSGIQKNTITKNAIADSNLNFSDDSPVRDKPFLVMWLTEDDSRVCSICFPLHGRTFDSPNDVPDIPRDTHPNCRCRVVPVDESGNPILG